MRCGVFRTVLLLTLVSVASYMFLRRLLLTSSSTLDSFLNSESKVIPFAANMATAPGNANWKSAKSIYDFSALDIDGNEVSLEKYRVARLENSGISLQSIRRPEPGTEADIKEFIKQYNVQFDMFSKINVNGDNTHPLWSYLKKKQGAFIKWNFSKFLIDKEGQPVKRYAPQFEPKDIEPDLLKYFSA
ncbi:phospholipid hydroperoxide glutathione peroxidase [Caerostris extrusa]|uniref:Phospholipid hydroperoxide glutathione peroxidase n=1 Tax=Caerostris extrusa TaxID=172846 RepID=A0AAV4NYQ5_CAEEX|nr:phospholipid hydroperoxide glutathione peroxidase [Caerostris extrusa]